MLKTGQHIVLLGMQATDERLLKSQYSAERKQTWFEQLYAGVQSCTPIDDFDVITLTDSEKQAFRRSRSMATTTSQHSAQRSMNKQYEQSYIPACKTVGIVETCLRAIKLLAVRSISQSWSCPAKTVRSVCLGRAPSDAEQFVQT